MIFRASEGKLGQLINKLPAEYRRCYITDQDLLDRVSTFKRSYSDILREAYIPDEPKIKSAEFAEILSYFLVKEHYQPNYVLKGPKKWRWKEDRNQPVHKTDIVLFAKQADSPSNDDLVVAVEVKAKATQKNSYDPIHDAVKGAHDDSTRRLAATINWLKSQYVKRNNPEAVEYLERFRNPVEHGSYQKHFNAVAVVDEQLAEAELTRPRDLSPYSFSDPFCIIVVSIPSLKTMYENVYEKIPASGGDLF
ncbi:hypothetical protein Sulac_1243 [Sulfobacillus acidophilus DSM 10332]|uniref:Anti-bacteriophage protein A/HamA C-terminal domain-containing protein n=1 Tax=Sulfobacillus acidophilus (strain ATCC 700253 / DSM 10332 / NAL) TaxID=679936 RepID=G8TVA3_SULAD|nr:hypothetical protein Sulac_1243 [Sulfobacillus acidophilus DSM 10332]